MKSFWLLLGMAFLDLVVAGAMAGRGERGVALLFMVFAVATAAVALLAKPELRPDPRGRLREVDPPFAQILGVAGASAILVAAGYVAVSTSQPAPAQAALREKPAVQSAPAMPARTARPPVRLAPAGSWLHKCVDGAGHASFQSAPCPAGSRQAWRRAVTPDREPARARIQATETARVRFSQSYQAPSNGRTSRKNSAACQAAREADRRYRAQPLRLVKHDGLRRHGDAIRSACG